MFKHAAVVLAIATLGVPGLDAQEKEKPNPATTKYDISVTAEDTVYTGTVDLTVKAGVVTGTMKIVSPGEITGTVAGTVKAGKMNLDFPYHYVAEGCDGRVAMAITLPEKADGEPLTGTVSITGCGRPDDDPLPGTVQLTRQVPEKK